MTTTPQTDFCPYKGLQPYTENDRKYFYGREHDQAVIVSNLFAAPLTVLYGASGVGKSSVLLAGVVPQLKEDPQVAVVVFRTWQGTSYQTALKSEVLNAIIRSLALRQIENGSLNIDLGLPFDEFLLECDKVLPVRGRILFVFDQFEEYLNSTEATEAESFDAEFARAINRREVPANFLLSMRDDGLSKLDRFQGRIPNLLGNLLRVRHLKDEDAKRAIREPLTTYNRESPPERQMKIEDRLIDALLEKAKPVLDKDQNVTSSQTPADGVETPVLQILLTRLWKEERGLSSQTLRLDTFEKRLGGAEHIIFSYLKDVMDTLSDSEREAAAAVFQFLTTPAKTKIAHEPISLASWAKLSLPRVQTLLERLSAREDKILRKILVAGEPIRYEIFHDVLGGPVVEWSDKFVHERETIEAEKRAAEAAEKKAREEALQVQLIQFQALAREQQQRAEAERLRAEAEQSRREEQEGRTEAERLRAEIQERRAAEKTQSTKRLRWLAAAMAILFMLGMATAAYAFFQRRQATISAAQASNEAKRANEQADRAVASERRAVEAMEESEKQRTVALENAAEALRQREITKQSELLAKAETKRANEQANLASQQKLIAELASREAEKQKQKAEAKNAELEKTQERLMLALTEANAERKIAKEQTEAAFRARNDAQEALKKLQESVNALNEAKTVDALKTEAAELERNRDYSGALDRYQRALTIYKQSKDNAGQASVLENIARIQSNQSNFVKVVGTYSEALSVIDPVDLEGRARIFAGLGFNYINLHQYVKAIEHLTDALKLSEVLNDDRGKYSALYGIAYTRIRQRDYKGGIDALDNGLKVAHEPYQIGQIYSTYALLHYEREDFEEAGEFYLKALKVYESDKSIRDQERTLNNLIDLYRQLGQQAEVDKYSKMLSALGSSAKP